MTMKLYGDGRSRVGVRKITPSIYWICHCAGEHACELNRGFASEFARLHPGFDPDANDIIYSSYLFVDEKTFLIDTLGPAQHETVLEAVRDILDGRPLDYLWISHTELPHAANTAKLKQAYPDMTVLTVGGHDHYSVHGLGDARLLNFGDTLSLGKHTIRVIEPVFLDHALTQWLYEETTGFLCPVDWALNAHNPDQCFRFMDEMEEVGYSAQQFGDDVAITNQVVFAWIKWADPDDIATRIDQFYASYDIRIFAPSHTQVIRKDVPKYLKELKRAMCEAAGARKTSHL